MTEVDLNNDDETTTITTSSPLNTSLTPPPSSQPPFIGTSPFTKKQPSHPSLPLPTPPSPSLVLSTVVSTFSFTSTLALSTYTQLKLLKVSTGTIFPIPTILGIVSVGVASLVSHGVSVVTQDCIGENVGDWTEVVQRCRNVFEKEEEKGERQYLRTLGSNWVGGGKKEEGASTSTWLSNIPSSWEEMRRRYCIFNSDWNKNDVAHALRVCTLGLIAFKLLGGRFWAISPSSYTNIGSFARASIPATSNYATPSERSTIERLGRISGCHTCGSRMIFTTTTTRNASSNSAVKFHGDHMPPQAVTKQMNERWFRKILGWKVKQRFYPQCVPCSNKQGSILAKATNELRKMDAERRGIKKVLLGGIGLPNLADAGGGKMAHFHGWRFRTSHFAGAVIAATTVGGNVSSEDLINGNRNRFRSIQEDVEEKFWVALTWMDDRFKRVGK